MPSREMIQAWKRRRDEEKQFIDQVYFIGFDGDAKVIAIVKSKPRRIYEYPNGNLEINYLNGRRSVTRLADGNIIAFGWQKIPIRESGFTAFKALTTLPTVGDTDDTQGT